MSPKQLAVMDPIVWKNISAGQPNFSKQHTKTAVLDNEPDIQVLLRNRPPFIVGEVSYIPSRNELTLVGVRGYTQIEGWRIGGRASSDVFSCPYPRMPRKREKPEILVNEGGEDVTREMTRAYKGVFKVFRVSVDATWKFGQITIPNRPLEARIDKLKRVFVATNQMTAPDLKQ